MIESEYLQLQTKIFEQFPNTPFEIDCITDIRQLDEPFIKNISSNSEETEPFTRQAGIIIKDDRANEHNYYYDNLTSKERNEYINYLGISEIDEDTPITLRQVLTAMINNLHYNNDIVKHDPHSILEGFDISSNGVVYTPFFGS